MNWQYYAEVFLRTFLHAGCSALIAIGGGFFAGLGLRPWLARWPALTGVILLPSTLPALFIATSILNLVRPFPFGLAAISVTHGLMNVGLVGVAVASSINRDFLSYSDVAQVMGVSRFQYILRVILPALRQDLFRLATVVFLFGFTSFSLPILIGGSALNSVEALIYEKIRQGQDWRSALPLAVLQLSIMIGVNSFIFERRERTGSSTVRSESHLSDLSWLIFLPLACLLVCCAGWFKGLWAFFTGGYLSEFLRENFVSTFFDAVAGTISVGLLTSLLVVLWLLLALFILPQVQFQKWLRLSVLPSGLLVGFAFWFLAREINHVAYELGLQLNQNLLDVVVIATSISIGVFPLLWRIAMAGEWEKIEGLWWVGRQMGANRFLLFRRLVLPNSWASICYCAGLGAFWACGDFAISSMISDHELTLGIFVQSLLGAYRLELAVGALGLLMGIGLLLMWLLGELRHVYR